MKVNGKNPKVKVSRTVRVSNALADVCAWMSTWFEECERRLRLCPACGQPQYYAPPCIKGDEHHAFATQMDQGFRG